MCYLFRVAALTRTGLNIETLVSPVKQFEKESKAIFLFSDFSDKMKAIQDLEKGVIPRQVIVVEDYGISRSFRRGSTAAAHNAPNSDEDIIRNNR